MLATEGIFNGVLVAIMYIFINCFQDLIFLEIRKQYTSGKTFNLYY